MIVKKRTLAFVQDVCAQSDPVGLNRFESGLARMVSVNRGGNRDQYKVRRRAEAWGICTEMKELPDFFTANEGHLVSR